MTRDRSLDIAVTGVSARFPGAADLDAWWTALTEGRVLTTRYEKSDLLTAGVPKEVLDDPDYVPVHGHLPDADRFDHALFGVSPREAEMMDPQHRLMLEVAWAALEDAGVAPVAKDAAREGGVPRTAVFASASGSGYLRAMVASGELDPLTLEDAIHGTEPDFMASLVSYKLGLTGPAVAVQTACSSSLVALHMAVQSLLNGDCDQALVVAAGVPYPQAGYLAVPGGIHSASGSCRPFDEHADGVVAGSGAACVVLRRLADALEDGSDPYGVVLGTAINNDGAAKAGYYAPSVGGQEEAIRAALSAADVDGDTIGYLETHGTGTRVGDPIEWSAASAALSGAGAGPGTVAVGALKANVGHLDNAAGVAALIKALLVVKKGIVPPVAGFSRLNPLLETDGSPLYVPTECAPWTGPEPRRAGVSSFGIGGTNVHVVVEQPPAPVREETDGREETGVREGFEEGVRLALVSAGDADALSRSAARLGARLAEEDLPLGDVAATLATGRAELPERLAVTGRTCAEVGQRLTRGAGVVRGSRPASGPAPVVLVFPGQGTQYPGMAVPVAEALPYFPAALDECLAAFEPALGERMRRALFDTDFPAAELAETELAQPVLFAFEYAAATALTTLGVSPAALAGHSLGEITAACVGGVFELADAARLVTVRGRAMQECPEGAMLALGCEEARARELLAVSGLGLELAAVNSADGCVVAGPTQAVTEFETRLAGRVLVRRLATRRAFHTALVEPALPRLAEALAAVTVRPPVVPFATDVTGRLIPPDTDVRPELFVDQARRTVRFGDAMASIAERFPDALVVEVGPGRVLSALAEAAGLPSVPLSPSRTARPAEEVLTALGTLWTRGQPLPRRALCRPGGRRVHLPTYPFAGPRWIAPEAAPRTDASRSARQPVPTPTPGPVTTPGPVPAPGPSVAETPTAPEPASPTLTAAAAPVEDPVSVLTRLWVELLGHGDLGEESDFFDLGGDSLLATRLARRASRELGVPVPVRDLMTARSLGAQAALLHDLAAGETPPAR
ncbi:polyketide synthase subunit [Streptomyces sp. JV178]|uniref:type I polyketide synthase n=1 Tax=Streptomyces sp. JV178 TaxID=858632 RepID=UPI000C1B22C2|nr:type I polyketide synthase [Streptomyces sp. JV178]PIM67857.1 polyketide synthase subunit [Streptomyces sp. JV178]